MENRCVLFMIGLLLTSINSMAESPKEVPDYIYKNKVVYMQDMYSPELDSYISLIKKVEGDHVVISKRLGSVPIPDDIPLAPDDSSITDAFVSCHSTGKEMQGDFLMIYLTEKHGQIQARYPTSYKCDFNKLAFNNAVASRYDEDKKILIMSDKNLCDGKSLKNLVLVANAYGQGILNIANDPRWGGNSVNIALHSVNMSGFYKGLLDIRSHDLYLKNSGCKSLVDGPTEADISTLNHIRTEVNRLSDAESNERGFITQGGY